MMTVGASTAPAAIQDRRRDQISVGDHLMHDILHKRMWPAQMVSPEAFDEVYLIKHKPVTAC